MNLRDYQKAAHDAVLAAWGEPPWHKEGEETFRSVLANLATSSGKTVIAGAIINSVRQHGRCLFLADTDELCAQPRRTFQRLFDIQAGVEKAGSYAGPLDNVVVGSAQTFQRDNRLERYRPEHFSYVFVDEAHRGSDRNKKIIDYFHQAKVMGMTATAFRAKLADLSAYYDHVAFEMGMFDLINEGYIAPIKVLTLPVNVDISGVHQKAGDYDAEELDTTIAPYYEEICRLVKEHAYGRTIICYLPLIKSSQEFVKIAQAHEINARHIDGKSEDREEILRAFDRGEFQLLSNSSLLTTGWDCPRCDCLLNLAPTRSAGLFRQKVGRIGRLLPGIVEGIDDKDMRLAAIAASNKPDALIMDLLWQTAKFGLQGPADLIAGDKKELEALSDELRKKREPSDLQEVSSEVQKQRETALAHALEALKKRAGEAINLIAALLHAKKVVNYEPLMHWESLPITEPQRAWLVKQGADPDSVKDRGHAKVFQDLIYERKKAGLAPHRVVQLLERMGVDNAVRCTAQRAYEILGGDYPTSFGKHVGRSLRAIPASYWGWMLEQHWFKHQFPIEYRWAMHVLHPETECTCIGGGHVAPNCPVHRVLEPAPAAASSDAMTEDDEIPF